MALAACFAIVVGLGTGQPVAAEQTATQVLPQGPMPAAPPEASTEQVRALEQQVQSVLTEARRQQVLLAQLREQLAAAESGNAWLPWLLLGLMAAGVLVVWLGLRLRRLKRELAHRRWAQAADERTYAAAGDLAEAHSASLLSGEPPLQSPRVDTSPGAVATVSERAITGAGAMSTPAVASAASALGAADFSFGTGVPPRPVSVEELLDLDQQVDFFLVLGQTQSAIDLLLGHVRSTGGTYALPYFKLLEIYRQQGDDEAYDRTRERFNQRFNALAPDLSGDMASGRSLEDYPDVVQRLQRAWPHPLRATAELESLLLRRADLEPFDLPAYRDILMLHALVRDLPAAALLAATTSVAKGVPAAAPASPMLPAAPEDGVDLLLPLDGDAGRAPPPPVALSERASAQAMLAEWVFARAVKPDGLAGQETDAWPQLPAAAPSAPVAPVTLDLDLSHFAPSPREFTEPVAFTDIDQRGDGRRSDFDALDDPRAPPPNSRR